ncbi:MAG TPA: shikimate dehydrogenase [Pyrinomonadaceae bacterium]
MPLEAVPQICVPVCESNLSAMKQAATRARDVADLVELRLDCLAANELNGREFHQFLTSFDHPLVLTLRPRDQGGSASFDLRYRSDFFSRMAGGAFLDIEFDLVRLFMRTDDCKLDWKQVICSHHDFRKVPADLVQIYERMAATPARFVKIAVRAADVVDCLPVFKLLERAKKDGRQMIAIAMGSAGVTTRILGPSRGSFLTYGTLKDRSATAPGQIPASSLKQLYRIDRIDAETIITGLVGNPVSHSVSPHIHNAAFADTGLNGIFLPFEVHDVEAFLRRMVKPASREIDWPLRGLSVTAPHKSVVMELLDSVDSAAREIGAVNTIVVKESGLHGCNTDAPAFIHVLQEKVGDLNGMNCAVIGAGGAARAALWGLKAQNASVTVFARNVQKASSVADYFKANVQSLNRSRLSDFDVVVNATPLGTSGTLVEESPVDAGQLRGARLAYDLVYNPSETRFLREARSAGCETLGGLSMLVNQAAEQFKLWTGLAAPLESMQTAAAKALTDA